MSMTSNKYMTSLDFSYNNDHNAHKRIISGMYNAVPTTLKGQTFAGTNFREPTNSRNFCISRGLTFANGRVGKISRGLTFVNGEERNISRDKLSRKWPKFAKFEKVCPF